MSKYRNALPQLNGQFCMTEGGLETTLIFHDGIDLPCFASFDLLKDEAGTRRLEDYYLRFGRMAREQQCGAVLETPTWRANPDWGARLGYGADGLTEINRKAIDLLLRVRSACETPTTPVVISGNLGPRGDGYVAQNLMSVNAARDYHLPQITTFADSEADLVSAFTMNYPAEAIGIIRAAQSCGMPVVISFTVETDGRLPSGDPLQQAIEKADQETGGYAAYYMINCAHPTHFERVLSGGGKWLERISGLRANASKRSHAELDESTELDDGNPEELGQAYRALAQRLPNLRVAGGCCGTDQRHAAAICSSLHTLHTLQPAL